MYGEYPRNVNYYQLIQFRGGSFLRKSRFSFQTKEAILQNIHINKLVVTTRNTFPNKLNRLRVEKQYARLMRRKLELSPCQSEK